MFDAFFRPLIDPVLTRVARVCTNSRISANWVTVGGFAIGVSAMVAVFYGQFLAALGLLIVNRIADGLDGAIARRTKPTDFGGYLDIVLDFIFYAGFVFAFALHDPISNALAAAFLIFSFIGTGCSFLAFAIIAAKRQIDTTKRGAKSFYYLGGLTEGSETIGLFVLMCLFPEQFAWFAWIFGGLCWITTSTRIAMAKNLFS